MSRHDNTALSSPDLADRELPREQLVVTGRRALDAGRNLIDIAPGYEAGYSEQIVGQAVKGYREGVFVIDKINSLDQPVAPQIAASRTRLQMDYTDLFVFHNLATLEAWSHVTAPGGGMEQLDQASRAGKTRFKGISVIARTYWRWLFLRAWWMWCCFPWGRMWISAISQRFFPGPPIPCGHCVFQDVWGRQAVR